MQPLNQPLTSSSNMPHVGKMIKEVMDGKPRSCTVTWLAGELNCCRENVYDIFRRSNIDMELLRRISIILDHDFFLDLSQALVRERDGVK